MATILADLELRLCPLCKKALEKSVHGNRKFHPGCAYQQKRLRQKARYWIGNSAKLAIQKNEMIASRLHAEDPQKHGFPYLDVLGQGLQFSHFSSVRKLHGEDVYFFGHSGYKIKSINREHFIIFYHDSEF